MRIILASWEWHSDQLGSFWRKPGGDYSGGCIDLRSLPAQGMPGGSPQGLGLFAYEDLPTGLVPTAEVGDDPLARMSVGRRNALADALGLSRAALSDTTLAEILAVQVLGEQADPTGSARAKPLRMNRHGAALYLGGFGELWRGRLDKDHPLYAKTLEVRRVDYIRERRRINRMRDRMVGRGMGREEAEARSLEALQKWTGWDMQMLDATEDELLPAVHRSDGSRRPATTLTETWPTDSTTVSSGQDEPWTEEVNDASVAAGKIGSVAAFPAVAVLSCDTALSSDDHRHVATAAAAQTEGNRCLVAVRYDTGVNGTNLMNAYALWVQNQTGNAHRSLTKFVAGAETALNNIFTNPGASYSMECKADGSDITGISAGTTQGPITDTALTGYLQVGLRIWRGGAAHSACTLDDHTFEDLGGTPVSKTVTAGVEHTEAVTEGEFISAEHAGHGVISGTVVLDSDSSPVEDALVIAVRQSSGEVEVTGLTDVAGTFALDPVEPGLFDVYVRRTDSKEALAQTTVAVT